MSGVVTLELPDHVVRSAQAAADVPVEGLSDEEILGLCDMQMAEEDPEALNHLVARNREGQLDDTDRTRLDALMQMYRRGLVRKAQAWKVAV
jgi:hypothetical protein